MTERSSLPYIISGPIIRRLLPEQLVLWLVTSQPLKANLSLYKQDEPFAEVDCEPYLHTVRLGESAYINLIDFKSEEAFPEETWLSYDLNCEIDGSTQNLQQLLPDLMYEGESRPGFVLKTEVDQILHGSCRKPHYAGDDALLQVDALLQKTQENSSERPAMLMMSGDQIYADDVAGPMLSAIHQVIELLGLEPEAIEGAVVDNSDDLYKHPNCYYRREQLLPQTKANREVKDRFFGGARKPIFTADTAHNHLITLSEIAAMYLLVWSPQLWQFIKLNADEIDEAYKDRYREEQKQIEAFSEGLGRVQRALAHLPVYMIFDDHDVTDDWNLTRGWEEAAYEHPFSRRIIGNALIGYWLFQGWGNNPSAFPEDWGKRLEASESLSGDDKRDALVDDFMEFEQWHYSLPTSPKLVVLDTRTQRWWSESSALKPSGLMDWEALSELQQELVGEPSVILVSPAPIFGMKLIEAVQRIFTYFGHALMVDAENWMAHRGSANVILNIFRHRKTPQNFIILSGDVHYSFAYDVKIRFRRNSPDIWQITCSGFKNEFPHKLLRVFDRCNRWLYGSRSPLNVFTKRRRMKIQSRTPEGFPDQRVLNQNGVGRVLINAEGIPVQISVVTTSGQEVKFPDKDA